MKKKPKKPQFATYEVQINITAHEDVADGYLELIYGVLVMGNLIVSRSTPCIVEHKDNHVQIAERFILKRPPLGSMGLEDIPYCKDLNRE